MARLSFCIFCIMMQNYLVQLFLYSFDNVNQTSVLSVLSMYLQYAV